MTSSNVSPSIPASFDSRITEIWRRRIATGNAAGSYVEVPDSYTFGEAIELRYRFNESGNAQRQGLFLNVRQDVANTSTIRAAEMGAESEGAIAVGTLEGANIFCSIRSTSTGNITAAYGLTGEFKHNSADYSGTVTRAAAIRAKFSAETGATYTDSSIFLAEAEPVSGAKALGSVLGSNIHANISFNALIDMDGVALTEVDTNKVNLILFDDSAGVARALRVDESGTVTAPTV